MQSEQQYIELYEQARELICSHAPEAMNAVRDEEPQPLADSRRSL